MFDKKMIRKYLSPLIIAKKGKEIKRFFNFKEFEKFNSTGWVLSYNKGLGSLDADEYSRMIHEPEEILFSRDDVTSIDIDIAFGPDSDKRKVWLLGE